MKMSLLSSGLVAASLLLSACSPFTRVDRDDPKTLALLDGNWTVRYVAGKEIQDVSPELNFDTTKGTLTGSDGCNRINGPITMQDGRLKAKVISTRMACTNETARAASQEINNLLSNGAEVVEVAMGKGRVLLMKNDSAEIRLIPTEYAK
ncbi:MAG: META domain-containing protein [Methylomicrobium sp.]|nr:META domain-containing protein [Methylomicrobium sp.]